MIISILQACLSGLANRLKALYLSVFISGNDKKTGKKPANRLVANLL